MNRIEATTAIKGKYVIIDDCIDTGATIRHIIDRMKKHHPKAKCVGIILHSQSYRKEFENLALYHI